MINLKEEIKLMDGDGDATLTLSLYQLECVQAKVEELEAFTVYANAEYRKLQAKITELTEWNGISIGLKCPACDDVGWYVAFSGEQEQCEFCYTCPDSIFNRKAALQESE